MTIEELQAQLLNDFDAYPKKRHYMLLMEFQRRLALLEYAMGYPGLYPFGNYALAMKKEEDDGETPVWFRQVLKGMSASYHSRYLYLAYSWSNLPERLQMGFPDTYFPLLKFFRNAGHLKGIGLRVMVNNSPWLIKPVEVALAWEEIDISDEALARYDLDPNF